MSLLEVGLSDYSDMTEIGRGESGVVYRARQTAFDREVAIKMLAASTDADALDRFAAECSAIGALSGHPNIVTVYGLGTADDGRPFIVMEFLGGGSLADRLATEGPLDWPEVLAIGVKLAGTLESAHRAGVLHCDVKPENVLFSRFNELRLVDFGVAQVRGATRTGRRGLVGTPAHAAPEVLEGQPVTPRSEIYSLASLLFTLLAGHPPHGAPGASSLVSLATGVTAGGPVDLGRTDVPTALTDVIVGALAKDPDDRPSDAARFGRQLQAIQASHGLAITPLPVEPGLDEPVPGPAGESNRPPVAPRRRHRAFWAGAVGLALLVAGTALALAGRSDDRQLDLVPLFQDNFDAGEGWYELDDESASLGYADGSYRIAVKRSDHQAISDSAFRGPTYGTPLTALRDVSVHVGARSASGTGLFGVTCRQAPGAESYYEGLLGADGTARITRYSNGRLQTLATGPAERPEPSQLTRVRLDCIGEPDDTRLSLFVHGRPVATAVDRQGLERGSVGLAAASGASSSVEAFFDDLSVFGRPLARS